jgi:hypothetical protein
VAVVALAVGGAFLIEHLAPPVGTANADNDHFEEFTNPFHPDRPGTYPAQFRAYAAHIGTFHWATLGAVAALAVNGFMIRAGILFRRVRFEDFLAEDDVDPARDGRETKRAGSIPDLVLPPWLVSATAAASFVTLAAVGAYAFFPSPEEIFRDMAIIKADYYGEIGAASRASPLHHLDLWERQAARLPVGAMIRMSGPDSEARRLTAVLRAGIRRLREATEKGRRDEARAIFVNLQQTYDRCKRAYASR